MGSASTVTRLVGPYWYVHAPFVGSTWRMRLPLVSYSNVSRAPPGLSVAVIRPTGSRVRVVRRPAVSITATRRSAGSYSLVVAIPSGWAWRTGRPSALYAMVL